MGRGSRVPFLVGAHARRCKVRFMETVTFVSITQSANVKVLSGSLILWFFFDVCLAFIPCGLFAALVSGSFTNYDLVLGWRILIFFLHFGVLASGLNVTVFVAMLLLGAGVSIGEPG